jgi:RNA polymerase sigma-70 factor (ECF subfamily)
MTIADDQNAAAIFHPLRPRLARIAYRMLGSLADAEDVVQEAFIRWLRADRAAVQKPEAFLRRTTTRLCLDQLKSARRKRETYVGPWLPDPVVAEAEEEEADDVTLPLMLALERLSPLERAAFLLHDMFAMGFEEIARTIRRDPAACRQLAARARTHVREARPRFRIEREHGLRIAEAFFKASRGGDMKALGALLAADVSSYADGGGKRRAATQPIVGIAAVLKLHRFLAAHFKANGSEYLRSAFINGLPGFVSRESDGVLQTTSFDIEERKISAIYVVRNPDKLRHLHQLRRRSVPAASANLDRRHPVGNRKAAGKHSTPRDHI